MVQLALVAATTLHTTKPRTLCARRARVTHVQIVARRVINGALIGDRVKKLRFADSPPNNSLVLSTNLAHVVAPPSRRRRRDERYIWLLFDSTTF